MRVQGLVHSLSNDLVKLTVRQPTDIGKVIASSSAKESASLATGLEIALYPATRTAKEYLRESYQCRTVTGPLCSE